MTRLLSLLIILLAAGAALYFAQHRDARDAVSANAVVDVAADLQRDVTRVPMRVTRLSDADEVRIGDELARRYGLSNAPQTPEMSSAQDYINRLGARGAAAARRKLDFHFYLDPNPDLTNAFALPGGHVVVGLGLINQMKSEDELAFVLAHEIEHIDHYHAVERLQIEAQLHKVSLDAFAALAQIPSLSGRPDTAKTRSSRPTRKACSSSPQPVIRRAAPSTCSPALSNSIANT